MAKIKYYYDTQKCRYERVNTKSSDILINILGFAGLAFLFALFLTFLYYQFFPSPIEMRLRTENDALKHDYVKIKKDLNEMEIALNHLQKRDVDVYRIITEADAPPKLEDNFDEIDYKAMFTDIETAKMLVSDRIIKIRDLRNRMKSQNASYDELLSLAKEKEKLLASTPAIQPIRNKELTRLASGFGMRMHPILKVKRFHKGIDFSAPRGTPIYATGDATVEVTKSSYGGYGIQVILNHGYGYRTRYGHMQSYIVKPGQKVKRGEQIGTVGNTGASTGPHVHYEVLKNGKPVNPVYYFFKDLDDKEFEEILRLASEENQSLS